MKITLVGAPGSGKTHIAKFIADKLNLYHIEADAIYWSGKDLRSEIGEVIKKEHWIQEGHLTKIADQVLPVSDKIIVIESFSVRSLWRTLRRDWKHFNKAWFNLQNYEKLSTKRTEIISELMSTRADDVITLNNFPDLSQSELAAFCEGLKSSPVKSSKPSVKAKGPGKIKEK